MVSTTVMLSDEYSHYVLRYSGIQSGLCDYNIKYPDSASGRDGSLSSILYSAYEAMFVNLMEDLEGFNEVQRGKVLDYFIEQIDRYEFRESSGSSR